MTATELYKAGKLQDAIEAQIKEVRSSPGDHAKRLFLFELLVFSGDVDRAQKQIEMIKFDEMELAAALSGYSKLLESERLRRKFFREGTPPRFFGEQTEHVHLRVEAVNRLREQRPDEAVQLLSHAQKAAPAIKGKLNDKPFESLRDCDDLFGTVIEVMAQGLYYWVPLDQVETISMNGPKFPRDLIWIAARLELREGAAGNVFLPTMYPFSHEHDDNQIKLGRMTDWKTVPGGPVMGVGSKMFFLGEEDIGLLEWRTLEVDEGT